ncbi:hypothetical protein ASG87_02865 [Frateuria sp. Soil773]|uniref:hypothetical protein n=1 Tax=Frateuria sp. Soil773 TaxID=1736407 RepID=UPI0006F57B25|nr:hypothetical protein [Frateuria sp. Soil773]KRE89301.1 hypothetical protein ASG87_02865 [Frateuria sp. Soil773]
MSAATKPSVRLWVGFLLAPLIPGLLFLLLSLLSNPGEGLWALKLSAMVGYPAMLVLGVPAHLLLTKRRWTSGWSYTLAGIAIGAIVAAVLFGSVALHNVSFIPDPNKSLGPSAIIFVVAALLGALAAWVFWLIARPNREPSA